jgi:hypothetical protein
VGNEEQHPCAMTLARKCSGDGGDGGIQLGC